MGGEDAAAPRYIHTELTPIVKTLFKKEDSAILEYTEDDGLPVEPVTYMPVIPTLLVNGALGIGTGFSTSVMPYNPADLIAALRWRLQGRCKDLSGMELIPWWFGFKGKVNAGSDGKTWITKGVYEFVDDDAATIRIKELPIGCWTQDYKDFLETLLVEQEEIVNTWKLACKKAKDSKAAEPEKPTIWLRGYDALYNDVDVDFVLHMDPEYYHEARAYPSEFETKFKMTTSFKTTNMVAFDVTGKIHRFASVGEILEMFYNERRRGYELRKAHELDRIEAEIVELNARLKFVKAVVEKRLIVADADDDTLLADLRALELPTLSDGEGLKGYEYLLRMRIDRIKAAAVAELEREVADALRARDLLAATTPETLWLNDLDGFEAEWTGYVAERTAAYSAAAETSGAAGGAKKKAVRKITKAAGGAGRK
jgi:DNA topoisomerase-2